MKAQYRVQLPPDARFSEWRDCDVSIKEDYILSIQFNEASTNEDIKNIMKDMTVK